MMNTSADPFPVTCPGVPEAILEEVCTHLEEAACRAASAPMTCQVLMTSGTLKDHQNGDLMVIWWYFLW